MHKFTALPLVVIFCACISASELKQVGTIDLPGPPGFDQVIMAKGMLLLSHVAADTVDIFDPAKRRLIGKVADMSAPRGIAVDPEGARVYIANSGARNLVVLTTGDFQVQRTIALPFPPQALLYASGPRMLYVSCSDDQRLLSVDPELGTATHILDTEARPQSLAFDAKRKQLYVALQDKKKIQAFDEELKPVRSFDLTGSMPSGMVYDEQLDRIYVAVRFAVLAIDAATGAEVGRVAAPGGIDDLWLDAPSRTLFGAANGSVLLMHAGQKLTAGDELKVDVKGHTLAFEPSTKLLYVPGGREGHSKLLILKQTAPDATAVPAGRKPS